MIENMSLEQSYNVIIPLTKLTLLEKISAKLHMHMAIKLLGKGYRASQNICSQFCCASFSWSYTDILRPKYYGWHLAEGIFNCLFLGEVFNFWLKLLPKGSIKNVLTMVEIMAWHQTGDQPLFVPMMACFIDAYMHQLALMSSHFLVS